MQSSTIPIDDLVEIVKKQNEDIDEFIDNVEFSDAPQNGNKSLALKLTLGGLAIIFICRLIWMSVDQDVDVFDNFDF